MEEVVGKLTACASSGPDWPYALVWLHKGTHHVALPKEGHLGILPQRGVEAIPCGQISQLEVCQLLITGPQVVYPICLNGCDKPIITHLPELLASSISLTASEPVYLEIDIPPPLVEKPDQKVLPLGKVSIIMIASPHKSTPQIGRGGQHDHWGKESPIPSGAGNVWLWVQKLDSQEVHPSGCPYASASEVTRITSASRHIVSGECRGGRRISRGNSHQHLPIAVASRSRSVTPQ